MLHIFVLFMIAVGTRIFVGLPTKRNLYIYNALHPNIMLSFSNCIQL